jgi:hypothetical protein
VICEARRRLRDGQTPLAERVPAITDRLHLPDKVPNQPALAAYVEAVAEWHQDETYTVRQVHAWAALARLLERDLSAVPSVRERILGSAAEAGLDQALPESIAHTVLNHADRPYVFSDQRAFLAVLAYRAHGYLSKVDFGRLYCDRRHRLLREVRDEVHRRIWRLFKPIATLTGEFGGLSLSLLILLIRIDHRIFVAAGLSRWRANRAWFALLRRVLGRLGAHAARQRKLAPPGRTGRYPTMRFVDVRATLPSIPRWRHELSKCRLSNSFESVCMQSIRVSAVISALQELLNGPPAWH